MKIYISTLLLLVFVFGINRAQSHTKDIEPIVAQKACNCISEIGMYFGKIVSHKKIKICVTSAIISNKVNNDLIVKQVTKEMGVANILTPYANAIDSLVVHNDKQNRALADEDYGKIEGYLLENCQALQTLVSNDAIELKNSVSDNKKARKHYNKGIKYFRNGDYVKALSNFRKAVKADQNFAFAWDNLGLCQRKTGKYKEAIKSYETSLALDPKGRMPLANIPIAYEFLKDYDQAIIGYANFSELYPDDPEGYYGISSVYYAIGDYEKALDPMFKAYLIYKEMQSPYIQDAEKKIAVYYHEMDKKGLLEMFHKLAEKHQVYIDSKK